MATPGKFSFSGWNSQSLAPKVNPATVKTPSQIALESAGGIEGIQLKGLEDAGLGQSPMANALRAKLGTAITTPGLQPPGAPAAAAGTLVGTTNAANTNLPQWLQAEVDRLNAQDALRTQMAGQVTGGAPAAPAFDPNIGVAAVTAARGQFNTSLNQINEQARLQNLIQQQNQLRPQGFGFMNPFDAQRSINLGREIEGYRNVNLPLAAGAVGGFRPMSGWVQPTWR